MKKFKNVKTGNIIHVNDAVANVYAASEQYEEVVVKGKKPEKTAE